MRIVLPGGTGHLGRLLQAQLGHDVTVIGRSSGQRWDGRTLGSWAGAIDGADAVINLAGRSVSCRYTHANLLDMMASRIDSTRVVGEAIAQATNPPKVWLQMSTATIYAHRFDAPNDEETGIIGGQEPDVPGYWAYSVRIAENWEAEQARAHTPHTRKVALRTAIVMSQGKGGAYHVLRRMARLGLGGPVAGGHQYVSWLHEQDFVRAVQFLIDHDLTGPVNLAAPNPLPQRDLMRVLRDRRPGLPATRWMAELGAFAIRSDTELLLKSRRVTPKRLLDAGFRFDYPDWPTAARDLNSRYAESAPRTEPRT